MIIQVFWHKNEGFYTYCDSSYNYTKDRCLWLITLISKVNIYIYLYLLDLWFYINNFSVLSLSCKFILFGKTICSYAFQRLCLNITPNDWNITTHIEWFWLHDKTSFMRYRPKEYALIWSAIILLTASLAVNVAICWARIFCLVDVGCWSENTSLVHDLLPCNPLITYFLK